MQTQTIVEKISSTLSSEKPYLIQLAKDHKWETPWVIDTSKNKPTDDEIKTYLSGLFSSLQTEMWIKDKEGLTTMFVLGHNSKYLISDYFQFLNFYFEAVFSYSEFSNLIKLFNQNLIGKDEFLLTDKPDIARVSIVNHWFSQNPVTVWEKKNPQSITLPDLDNKFSGREDLLKTTLNFQGMACVYDFANINGYHAIKPQVGIKQGNGYILEKPRILNFLKNIYNI